MFLLVTLALWAMSSLAAALFLGAVIRMGDGR